MDLSQSSGRNLISTTPSTQRNKRAVDEVRLMTPFHSKMLNATCPRDCLLDHVV
jgi:hypothetical protein